MPLTCQDVYAKIRERFPDAVERVEETAGDPFAVVRRERLVEVCRFLRDDPVLQFTYCACVSGVDDRATFWVVYHLHSIPGNHDAILKTDAGGREDPWVPSVCEVWPGADWHEREAYDMYGIRFEGHPDLRRILLPEDWPGYPLRKDYDFPDEYQGIPLK